MPQVNENRPGYKETKVGWIPEHWEIFRLNDCIRDDAPICYGILMPGKHVPDGIPVIKVRNFRKGQLRLDGLLRTSRSIDEEYTRSRLEKGDLLLSIRGSTGDLAIVPESLSGANITQDTARIRLNTNVFDMFVYFSLQGSLLQRQILINTIGQAVKGINIGEVRKLQLPLPPLSEQKKIAEILATWYKAIEILETLIEVKDKLKKGLMQQLLTGKKRLSGFGKPARDGEIPEGWDRKHLGDCSIGGGAYGLNAAAVEYSPKLPTYLRITDIDETGKFVSEKKVSVDNPDAGKYYLDKGEIVFARTGNSTGKTYLYDESDGPLVYAGFLIKFRPNPKKLNCAFLKHLSETAYYQNWVKMMSTRSGQPGINSQEYASFFIPLPALLEQEKITEILSNVDVEMLKLRKGKKLLSSQKKGLMQKLLTGEVRVRV